jgi:hypothetical protein
MTEIDFWGNEVKAPEVKPQQKMGYCQLFRAKNKYRLGSDDKKCRTCANVMRKYYHQKTYYKCKELGNSGGEGTDIRLKYVCDLWRRND